MTEKKQIKSFARIEFEVEINEKFYSLVVPHGTKIDDALEAAGYFLSALGKLKEEQEKTEEEKKDVIPNSNSSSVRDSKSN